MKHFILGGARSGKSRYAETIASDSGLSVLYIATAQVYDDEFAQRIAHHRERRPVDWGLIEEPFHLAEVIRREARADRFLLIDCLTLYLAQWLCTDCNPPQHRSWSDECAALPEALANAPGSIAVVSNEVGLGIVPLGEINRRYQDEAGRLNQAVASVCDRAVFMAAGLPLILKHSV
jgi:adenosylcobinamide kinase / adenosylcobinamide-phosphate guanylyltransferase